MKKILLFTLHLLIFCPIFSNSQDVTIGRDSSWKKSLQTGINVNQSSISDNWKGGGVNAIALGAFLDARADYVEGKISFINDLKTQYGMVNVKEQGFQKNVDRIFFDSKLGYIITPDKKWDLFFSVNFQSQFSNGYDYLADSAGFETNRLLSRFMSPGYLTSSIGVQYSPTPYFWMRLGTGTLRQTFVLDTTLYRNEPKNYGVEIGKKVRNEVALQFIANFEKELTKNMVLKARYMAFANYETMDAIDSRLDISFTAKITKYINVSLTGAVLYDQDIDYKIQYSQALALGILYQFTEFKE